MNVWPITISAFVLGFTALMIATIILIKTYRMEGVTKKLSDKTDEIANGIDKTKKLDIDGEEEKDEREQVIEEYGVFGGSKILMENCRLQKENEELKKKLAGDRVCDGYCTECVNGIIKKGAYGRTDYYCKLDCKCMDFKRKRENNELGK